MGVKSVQNQYERIHVNRMFASVPAEDAFGYYQEMERKASLPSQSTPERRTT